MQYAPALHYKEEDRFKPYYIHLSELVYGKNFQSPGNEEILRQMIASAVSTTANPVEKALDIGTGCGGNAIFLQNEFHCPVTAIEINEAFIEIARSRFGETPEHASIKLINQSVLDLHEPDTYDIATCRDVLMYIFDKHKALTNIFHSLKPGGQLIILDYCKNDEGISEGFQGYIERGGYDLLSIERYRQLFDTLKFKQVIIKDMTQEYIHYLQAGIATLDEIQKESIEFADSDIEYIRKRSSDKIQYCLDGSMTWIGINAEK